MLLPLGTDSTRLATIQPLQTFKISCCGYPVFLNYRNYNTLSLLA